MRYMMLVCVDESVEVSEAEGSPTAWVDEMEARGVRQFGARLRPVSDATTVRVRGGEVVLSDGPFAETKEQIGGLRPDRVRGPRRGDRGRLQAPGRQVRDDRGAAVLGGVSTRRRGRRSPTAFREEWGRVVATLIRLTGDWDLAEECAQDAFAQALERWPRDGVPRRPAPG